MTAGKRLIGYCAVLLTLLVLLFCFSQPYLLWMLVILLAVGLISAAALGRDARRVQLEVHAASGGRAGQPLRLTLHTGCTGALLAADCAVVDLEVYSVMFGVTEKCRLLLPLRGDGDLETSVSTAFCGETQLRCTDVRLVDSLDLFRARCKPFAPVRTVLYPAPVDVEVLLSSAAAGPADTGGLMQNRRGSDPSEVFDIREYVPGDDVRTIHWKLSCKTEDTLIVREPSDPSRYDTVLLPDMCRTADGSPTAGECNTAAALTAAIGQGLLRQGVSFCLAVPSPQGLLLWEVRTQRDLQRLLPRWMSMPLSAESGTGLRYFCAEHLEQHFTRLLVLSAGRYDQPLDGLERRIGVTVVSSSETVTSPVYAATGPTGETVLIPAAPKKGETVRIIC